MSIVAPGTPPPPAAPVPSPGGAQAPNAAGLVQMMGLPPAGETQDAMDAKRMAQDMEPMFKALKVVQKLLDSKPHLSPLVETFLKQMARSKSKRTSAADKDGGAPAPLTGGSATPVPPMAGMGAAPPAPSPRPFPGAL